MFRYSSLNGYWIQDVDFESYKTVTVEMSRHHIFVISLLIIDNTITIMQFGSKKLYVWVIENALNAFEPHFLNTNSSTN